LPGFLKVFNFADIEELTSPISKPAGMIWMITCLLFLTTAVLFLADLRPWFGFGFTGILLSQYLIIKYWKDAKTGTIPNVFLGILLVMSL